MSKKVTINPLARNARDGDNLDGGRTAVWLPKHCDHWALLEKLGITYVPVADSPEISIGPSTRSVAMAYYVEATLPAGWSIERFIEKEPTMGMWIFRLLDANRHVRAEIEDDELEGRSVTMNVKCRFDVHDCDRLGVKRPAVAVVWDNREQRAIYRAEEPLNQRLVSSETWSDAWHWLEEHYPEHRDPSAYWEG